jgi:hypothetical protein
LADELALAKFLCAKLGFTQLRRKNRPDKYQQVLKESSQKTKQCNFTEVQLSERRFTGVEIVMIGRLAVCFCLAKSGAYCQDSIK